MDDTNYGKCNNCALFEPIKDPDEDGDVFGKCLHPRADWQDENHGAWNVNSCNIIYRAIKKYAFIDAGVLKTKSLNEILLPLYEIENARKRAIIKQLRGRIQEVIGIIGVKETVSE